MSNTIILKGRKGRFDEAVASAAFYPGHLLQTGSNGQVAKHASGGKKTPLIFARENALVGGAISTVYAATETALLYYALPGDKINARLPIACPAVVVGTKMMSNGAGCLVPIPAAGEAVLYNPVADSTTLSNFTTITPYDNSYTIPANTLAVGDIIRVRGLVVFTGTNSTDTAVITLKIGSTTIIATAAVDNANSDIAEIVAFLTIRTIGASGTFVAEGTQANGVPGTVTAKPWSLSSTAIDTTVTNALTMNCTYSVASNSNTSVLRQFMIELVRGSGIEVIGEAAEAVDNSIGAAEVNCAVNIVG